MVLWRHNAFVGMLPWLAPIMANPYVRGAVTGIGIVTLGAGLRDLASVLFARTAEPTPTPDDPRRLS